MENEHVVSGLIRKRGEIVGRLEAAQSQVRQLILDLDNLDATIRLFAPDVDLDAVKVRPVPPRHAAGHGEVSRLIMDILRNTVQPVTTRDVAFRVMAARSLSLTDRRLNRVMVQRVGKSLRQLRERGVLEGLHGARGNMRWRLTYRATPAG